MIDPYNFISYPVWLSLPEATRYKIAELYGIQPRGVRQTTFGHGGGHIVTDAFIHGDLAVITKESMSEKTGIKSDDFYIQFQGLVDLVDGKLNNIQHVPQEEPAEAHAPAKKSLGRPRKGGTA